MSKKDESIAAISAIDALQKKLKDLQLERGQLELEYNGLLSHTRKTSDQFTKREQELNRAAQRAQAALNDSAEMLVQIQGARRDNAFLRKEIAKYKEMINEKVEIYNQQKGNYDEEIATTTKLDRLVKQYESLLPMIFMPPALIGNKTHKEPKPESLDLDLLPSQLRRIAIGLHKLPSHYQKQDIETKRAIIQGLIFAREECLKLSLQIYELEKAKTRSAAPRSVSLEINSLRSQFATLSNAMQRFVF